MLDFFPKTTAGDIFRRFLIYFPVGLVAVSMIVWMIARLDNQRMALLVERQERSQLRQLQQVLGHQLSLAAADLRTLAECDSLKRYLQASSPASLAGLAERLLFFIEVRQDYDQVVLRDHEGRELVGKNRLGRATADDSPPGDSRDPVQEWLTLENGELAISVNSADGQQPHDPPVLSLSTPIFDEAGRRRGLVTLDYRTSRLAGALPELLPEMGGGRFLLVDQTGRPLKISTAGQDGDLPFVASWPEFRRAMDGRAEGQVRTADGLFTFARVLPAMEIRQTAAGRQEKAMEHGPGHSAERLEWHLVAFAPLPEFSPTGLLRQASRSSWAMLGLGALAAGALQLAVSRARKERSERAVALLSTAIEQSPAAALITDMDGRIRYANLKFLAMSGYTREEIVGQNPRIFKSEETEAGIYRDLWQTIRAGRVWSGEFQNTRKDKSPYMVSAKISPIFASSGAIRGYLAIQEDITERRRLQQQLERLATIDGLTGICNRSHFLHLFSQELRREERYGLPLCLLIFDLDHFKAINDSYGHQTGDRVLEEFARVVSSSLRDTDIFGRLGGEEFGVLLLQTDLEGARLLAERLRNGVEKMRVACGEKAVGVTVSIGGTPWERGDRQVEAIISRADIALYEAKRRGRNQVYFTASTGGEGN